MSKGCSDGVRVVPLPCDEGHCSFHFVSIAFFFRRVFPPCLLFLLSLSFSLVLSDVLPAGFAFMKSPLQLHILMNITTTSRALNPAGKLHLHLC